MIEQPNNNRPPHHHLAPQAGPPRYAETLATHRRDLAKRVEAKLIEVLEAGYIPKAVEYEDMTFEQSDSSPDSFQIKQRFRVLVHQFDATKLPPHNFSPCCHSRVKYPSIN